MNQNASQHNRNQSSVSLLSNGTAMEPRTILPSKCSSCKDNNLDCDSGAPCTSCTSLGKSDICTNSEKTVVYKPSDASGLAHKAEKPANANRALKRGYKSHVPSACINCKTAHLACDVSRPCKRCVSLKKEDTCQDMQHKKRGRPKLREKKIYSSNEHSYEILYGTIETPAIMVKNTGKSILQMRPFSSKPSDPSPPPPPAPPPQAPETSTISFVHETFQPHYTHFSKPLSPPPLPSSSSSSSIQIVPTSLEATLSSSNTSADLAIDTEVLPTVQLSSDPLTSQSLFYNDSSSSSHITPVSNPPSQPVLTTNTIATSIQPPPNSLTLILSMEVCCAKVSDDTIRCWGYYPQELAHRSLYDFISTKDADRLARLHRLLIDNAMKVIEASQTDPIPSLSHTERTTSVLFSNTDQKTLCTVANGSKSFSDTIHIKKRDGEYELYKVVVYIGGGLGADLHDVSTLSKQYIVAQFKRHEYEVVLPLAESIPEVQTNNNNTTNDASLLYTEDSVQPIAVFSPLSPLTPTSPISNSSILNFGSSTRSMSTTTTSNQLESFRRDSSVSALHHINNVGNSSNNNNSSNNHAKFSSISSAIHPSLSPKFNIAPTTPFNSLFHRFLPKTTSTASPSSSTPVHLQNTSSMTVTHPTQQYFLQTSSSTLNAAASAAQNKSRTNIVSSSETSTVVSDRKMEMSIRSLLC